METMSFENPGGFDLHYSPDLTTAWKTIYRFELCRRTPLSFVDRHGARWQPNRSFYTDQGSVPRFPPFLRLIVPKDRFLAFYIHDSGYVFGGLYVDGKFRNMTRKAVDDLLYDMILADPKPGNRAVAYAVWMQVRLYGGWCGWKRGDIGKRPIDPHGMGGVLKMA